MKPLADAEWATSTQSLVDLLLTLAHQSAGPASDTRATATPAAILCRILQSRRAAAGRSRTNAGATSPRVRAFSERCIRKLFEGIETIFLITSRAAFAAAMGGLSILPEAHRSIPMSTPTLTVLAIPHISAPHFRHRFGLPPPEIRPAGGRACDTAFHGLKGDAVRRGMHWPDCVPIRRSGAARKIAASTASKPMECKREADQLVGSSGRLEARHS